MEKKSKPKEKANKKTCKNCRYYEKQDTPDGFAGEFGNCVNSTIHGPFSDIRPFQAPDGRVFVPSSFGCIHFNLSNKRKKK